MSVGIVPPSHTLVLCILCLIVANQLLWLTAPVGLNALGKEREGDVVGAAAGVS